MLSIDRRSGDCMCSAKCGFEEAGPGRQVIPSMLDGILDETFTRVKGEMEDEMEDESGRYRKW
jgi:hypothetical protein